MSDCHVVAFLGKGPYRATKYCLEENPEDFYTGRFSSVALARFVRAHTIHVLATPEAAQASLEPLQQEAHDVDVEVSSRQIHIGGTTASPWIVYRELTDLVRSIHGDVYLDITTAFRFLPFVAFAALRELEAEAIGPQGATFRIRGIRYALLPDTADVPAPLLDLYALIHLGDAFLAATLFRDTADPTPLAAILRHLLVDPSTRHANRPRRLGPLQHRLRELGRALSSALPIDAGIAAAGARAALPEAEAELERMPPARRLVQRISPLLDRIALPDYNVTDLQLDIDELQRQLRFVEVLARHDLLSQAALVLTEWFTNRCLLAWNLHRDWLDYHTCRSKARSRLNALVQRRRSQLPVPPHLSELISTLDSLESVRNSFAHAGFRRERVNYEHCRAVLHKALEYARNYIHHDDRWHWPFDHAPESVLITPLGRARGALYTALRKLKPDRALVIASSDTASALPDICSHAGYDPSQVTSIALADPFDVDEAATLASRAEVQHLFDACPSVYVNHTGGTTAMGLACRWIAGKAQQYGAAVRHVVLIDRRPRDDQERDPYVEGEVVAFDV